MKRLWADLRDRPRGVLRLCEAGAGDGTRTRTGLPPTVFKADSEDGQGRTEADLPHSEAEPDQ